MWLAAGAGCLVEFPDRGGVIALDASTPTDILQVGAEFGAAPTPIQPQSLEVVFTPHDLGVRPPPGRPDAGPTSEDASGPAPDGEPEIEVCDGRDNDRDGKTDEGASTWCEGRDPSTPHCADGECKACVPGTNEGCGRGFRCLADRGDNICAQCTPEANTCPAESPYCSPETLVCVPCPEILVFDQGHIAERCHDAPFGGECAYRFRVPEETPASCASLCLSIGMGCRGGRVADPEEDEEEICPEGGTPAGCVNDRLGELICDCIQ